MNGEKAKKGTKRGQMLLRRDDGKEVIAKFRYNNLWADVPQLVIAKKNIQLAKPLTWKEWAFVGSPIILIFLGGALGDRTQLEIIFDKTSAEETKMALKIFPINPVGQELLFGARKGVPRKVLSWFIAHTEHRLKKE